MDQRLPKWVVDTHRMDQRIHNLLGLDFVCAQDGNEACHVKGVQAAQAGQPVRQV